jgi:hypothetical protein
MFVSTNTKKFAHYTADRLFRIDGVDGAAGEDRAVLEQGDGLMQKPPYILDLAQQNLELA